MLCPGCERDNPSLSAFCGYCGQPIPQSLAATRLDELPGLGTGSVAAVPQQAPPADEQAGPRAVSGDHPAPAQRASGGDSATTRYLCAAVALDEGLRRRVLHDVLEEEHRAVITTPGVDLVSVLKYALAAHRRQVIRDAVLLVLLVLLVVLFFLIGALASLACLVAAWITVWIERYANSWGVARDLRPETFRPHQAPEPGRSSYAARQLQRIAAAGSEGNVTLYSRFPPFVGYGVIRSSWSFTVDVTRPRQGDEPRMFSVHEIYDYVQARLGELDFPGMTVSTRVFIDGRDIAEDRRFLPDPSRPPVTSISAELLRDLMSRPEERARPYLAVGLTSWQGDVVFTQFTRFLLSRSDLFVEAAHTVMPPLRSEFKEIDDQEREMELGTFFALAGGSLVSTIPRLLGSISRLAHELGTEGRRERKRRQVERAGDYGALFSVREMAASRNWDRYFQVLDDARFRKVIEQRIFRSLVEFLEEHDIDASELKSKTDVVVNSGVMVTGGTVSVGAIAAGSNAQAGGSVAAQAADLVGRLRGGDSG